MVGQQHLGPTTVLTDVDKFHVLRPGDHTLAEQTPQHQLAEILRGAYHLHCELFIDVDIHQVLPDHPVTGDGLNSFAGEYGAAQLVGGGEIAILFVEFHG